MKNGSKMRSTNGQIRTLFNPRGAGRPKKKVKEKASITHKCRPIIDSKHPMHLTIKILPICKNLRINKIAKFLKIAVLFARKAGLAIIHFSLQKDHIHLLAEAQDKIVLAAGMKAFGISFAKRINKLLKRTGSVYKERYHLHQLKTPKEVRFAMAYVLGNGKKHGQTKGLADQYSSIALMSENNSIAFKRNQKLFGFKEIIDWNGICNLHSLQILQDKLKTFLSQPNTWLLKKGWEKSV